MATNNASMESSLVEGENEENKETPNMGFSKLTNLATVMAFIMISVGAVTLVVSNTDVLSDVFSGRGGQHGHKQRTKPQHKEGPAIRADALSSSSANLPTSSQVIHLEKWSTRKPTMKITEKWSTHQPTLKITEKKSTQQPKQKVTQKKVSPQVTPTKGKAQPSVLHFPVVGDWGSNTKCKAKFKTRCDARILNQKSIAHVMNRWCANVTCDFILSTGDNIYPHGATSPGDPRFKTTWEDVYTGRAIKQLRWYMSIGNHDHGYKERFRELNQVKYSKTRNPRWHQPSLWYSFRKQTTDFNVDFMVLDSESISKGRWNVSRQVRWLDQALRKSDADWTFVVAHHPIYTSGPHGPVNKEMRTLIEPILERYKNVRIVFHGHDHNLQHIRRGDKEFPNGIDYVISGGGGGSSLYASKPKNVESLESLKYQVKHFTGIQGFVGVKLTKKVIKMEFIDKMYRRNYVLTRNNPTSAKG